MNGPAWGTTPRASIEAECVRRGREQVVWGCRTLLSGGETDAQFVAALAGPTAPNFLDLDRNDRYWLRVWGARGLLWAWDDSAAPDIRSALKDDAWRVREMALKVIARHQVDHCLEAVLAVQQDRVPRVRAAAARALVALTSGGKAVIGGH